MFRRPSVIKDISSLRVITCSNESTTTASLTGSSDEDQSKFGLPPSPMDDILPPLRPLTTEEHSELTDILRSTLNLSNTSCAIQAEEDVCDLINYAFELIDDKMTVGDIIEELEFMDLEICNTSTLREMRKVLAIFLSDLQDDVCDDDSCVSGGRNFGRSQSMPVPTDEDEAAVFRMAEAAAARRASAESALPKKPTNHVNIDLSSKNATIKKEEEMSQLLSRGMSIKERMAMYKANTENENDTPQDVLDIDKVRREELEDAMKDPSLTEKEQTDKMKEIRAKYGMMEMQIKIDQAKKSSVNTKKVPQEDNVEVTQATRAERELTNLNRRSSVDLSAKSVAVKKAQELTSIQRQSSNIKDRLAKLKEAQSKKDLKEEVVRSHLQVTEDENATARRNELMKIMRRRSLCKEEKEVKMQEVKQKYAEQGQEDEQVAEKDERREEVKAVIKNRRLSCEERKQALNIIKWKYSTSSSSTVPVPATRPSQVAPRNAKSYAQRRRSSLEALEQAIGSDGKSYAQRRRSSIEQLQQNMNGSSGPTRVLSLRERIALLGTN